MIVGFCQLRNELENGHLIRFSKNMNSLCDKVYVWDQDSTDNSRDIYEKNGWDVVYSAENLFHEEMKCKSSLLSIIKSECEGWILWLDGDSTLPISRSCLSQLMYSAEINGCDCISFGHLNLWDNENTYRVDNNYMHLDSIGVIACWKISEKLSFSSGDGLHNLQYPVTLRNPLDAREIKIHHYGFLKEEDRVKKYELYKSLGQTGYDLERIVDVSTLSLKEV